MYQEKLRLDGKNALVIGAGGGGIGTATSLALAEAGATVVAVDFQTERLRDTEERLAALGATCIGILADVRDTEQVKRAVAQAIKETGRIDCLVNLAGGNQAGEWWRLEDYPDDVYERVMNLNLRYVFVAGREVARHMIESDIPGSIVNFSSVSALQSAPYYAIYGVAKAGVIALSRTMAVEWGQYGIRVNAIVPGSVLTPRTSAASPEVVGQHEMNWNPIPRRGRPEEVAAAVLFLLSDLASMITGQALNVDCGVSARSPHGGLERFARRLSNAPG